MYKKIPNILKIMIDNDINYKDIKNIIELNSVELLNNNEFNDIDTLYKIVKYFNKESINKIANLDYNKVLKLSLNYISNNITIEKYNKVIDIIKKLDNNNLLISFYKHLLEDRSSLLYSNDIYTISSLVNIPKIDNDRLLIDFIDFLYKNNPENIRYIINMVYIHNEDILYKYIKDNSHDTNIVFNYIYIKQFMKTLSNYTYDNNPKIDIDFKKLIELVNLNKEVKYHIIAEILNNKMNKYYRGDKIRHNFLYKIYKLDKNLGSDLIYSALFFNKIKRQKKFNPKYLKIFTDSKYIYRDIIVAINLDYIDLINSKIDLINRYTKNINNNKPNDKDIYEFIKLYKNLDKIDHIELNSTHLLIMDYFKPIYCKKIVVNILEENIDNNKDREV